MSCPVSVIVPVYNMERCLEKCLQSVLAQTYRDYQMILIDDGSTDGSLELCHALTKGDPRVWLVSRKNEGLGPARDLGVSLAAGEYITFLDADDWWSPEYLEEMTGGTEAGQNDIVCCDIAFTYRTGCGYRSEPSILRVAPGAFSPVPGEGAIHRARTFMCGKLFRRELFTSNGICQPAHAYEDVATAPFLTALAKRMYRVPKAMYFYLRDQEGSITNDFGVLQDLLLSMEELLDRFRDRGLYDAWLSDLRRLIWGQLCSLHWRTDGKFSGESEAERERLCRRAAEIFRDIAPHLANLETSAFRVQGEDPLLYKGLSYLLPEPSKQLRQDGPADILVYDASRVEPPVEAAYQIGIDVAAFFGASDQVSAAWDISDEIFKRICASRHLGQYI